MHPHTHSGNMHTLTMCSTLPIISHKQTRRIDVLRRIQVLYSDLNVLEIEFGIETNKKEHFHS